MTIGTPDLGPVARPPGSDSPVPHLIILAACSSILLAALLLTPAEPTEPVLRIGGIALPSFCVMKQASGLPCPGCGLTRSVVSAAHGDWWGSFSHHRLGIALLIYLVFQSVLRLAWLGLPVFRAGIAPYCRLLNLAIIPLLVLLVINWLPTLLGEIAGVAPLG
jgi:hypothetical protein